MYLSTFFLRTEFDKVLTVNLRVTFTISDLNKAKVVISAVAIFVFIRTCVKNQMFILTNNCVLTNSNNHLGKSRHGKVTTNLNNVK